MKVKRRCCWGLMWSLLHLSTANEEMEMRSLNGTIVWMLRTRSCVVRFKPWRQTSKFSASRIHCLLVLLETLQNLPRGCSKRPTEENIVSASRIFTLNPHHERHGQLELQVFQPEQSDCPMCAQLMTSTQSVRHLTQP